MVESTKACVADCPSKTADMWIPLTQDNVCARCLDSCAECMYSRDHCTVCEEGFFFYQYSCLPKCPHGFQPISEEEAVCVRDGDVCAFGYFLNEDGECVLNTAHCEKGYILNDDQSKCIPLPGFHLPFAFLYAALIWTCVILRPKSRAKYPREILVT